MRTVKLKSVNDIPADDMSRLTARSSLYENVQWIRYCEMAARGSLYYIALADDTDSIVALTAIHFYESPSPFVLRRPETLLDDQQFASSLYPCLTGVLDGVHTLLLLAPHLEGCRQLVVSELMTAVCEEGAARQAATICFPYLTCQATAQAASLALNGSAGTLLTTAGVAVVTSRWPDFDGYVRSLERRWQSSVRRERRRFTDAGYRIRVDHGTSGLDVDTARLQANMLNKHGSTNGINDILDGYKMLSATVLDNVITFRCESNGTPVGVAVCLRDADVMYVRSVGIDDKPDKSSFTYFNTMFYAPIEWGSTNGIRRYGFGSASYQAKRQRGCVFERRYGAIRWPTAHQAELTESANRRQAGLCQAAGW